MAFALQTPASLTLESPQRLDGYDPAIALSKYDVMAPGARSGYDMNLIASASFVSSVVPRGPWAFAKGDPGLDDGPLTSSGTLTSLTGQAGNLEKLTVRIKVEMQGGPTVFGTGFLVDNTHLITAAHIVDGWENGTQYTVDSIRIVPNYDKTGQHTSPQISVASWELYPGWAPATDPISLDLAVCTLGSSVGYNNKKFIGLSAFYGDAVTGHAASTRGYPAQTYDPDQNGDNDGLTGIVQWDMYRSSGTTQLLSNGIVDLLGSIQRPGQSGAALVANSHDLSSDQTNDKLYDSYILGIATNRVTEADSDARGPYLTAAHLAWLMARVATGDANDFPFNYIFGSASAETIAGTVRRDVFSPGAGADTIAGAQGNDFVRTMAGNSSFDGGSGNDTLSFLANGSGLTIDLLAETAGNGRTFDRVENLIATNQADTLTIQSQAIFVAAGAGNDTLHVNQDFSLPGTNSPAVLLGAGTDSIVFHPVEDPSAPSEYPTYFGAAMVLDPDAGETVVNGRDGSNIFGWVSGATVHVVDNGDDVWRLEHDDFIVHDDETDEDVFFAQVDKSLRFNILQEGNLQLVQIIYQSWEFAGDPGAEGFQDIVSSDVIVLDVAQFGAGDFGLTPTVGSVTIAPEELQDRYTKFLKLLGSDTAMAEFAKSDISWEGLLPS